MLDHKEFLRTTHKINETTEDGPSYFPELENSVEKISRQIGRTILQNWLEACEDDHPKPTTKCRWCGADANYISKRVGTVWSKFGLVRYRRAFYLCPNCHQCTYPLDERLDPYASLARLRMQIAEGRKLPVNELAKAWGLGSLNQAKFDCLDIKLSSQDDLPLSSHLRERNPNSHTHIYNFPSVSATS